VAGSRPEATVVRGVLILNWGYPRTGTVSKAALLDISGREVLDLRPGVNDVSRLASGVYLVCGIEPNVVARVVIAR
jgi:hypothetical protein